MIVIYGTHLSNDNVFRCLFNFLKILLFEVVNRVRGKKWSKMTKNSSVVLNISGTIHDMIVIYGALM